MNSSKFLIALWLSFSFCRTLTPETLYKKVENTYLKSFNIEDQDAVEKLDNDTLERDIFGIALPRLSDLKQKETIFDIFSEHNPVEPSRIINDSSWKDLELFCGAGRDAGAHIFSRVDRTETNLGRVALAHMLASPITDITKLKKRQRAIKELVNNKFLFNKLEEQIQNIKKTEPQLVAFWNEDPFIQHLVFKKLFFSKNFLKKFNDNPYALEVLRRSGVFDPVWSVFEKIILLSAVRHFIINGGNELIKFKQQELRKKISDLMTSKRFADFVHAYQESDNAEDKEVVGTLAYITTGVELDDIPHGEVPATCWYDITKNETETYLKENASIKKFFHREFNEFKRDVLTLNEVKELVENTKTGIAKIFESEQKHGREQEISGESKRTPRTLLKNLDKAVYGLAAALCIWVIVSEARNVIPKIQSEREKIDLTNYLQRRLTNVAGFFGAAEEIYENIVQNKKVSDGLLLGQGLKGLYDGRSDKLDKLTGMLGTKTFIGSPSYFSFNGRVLASYKLMFDTQKEIGGALESVGEIDALMSIARLYKESQQNKAVYSFPKYVENKVPKIDIKDFWNPFINPNKVVTNSVELGGSGVGAKNIILTGPNAGGKSTVLKGITINLLLAQTLCIAPSSSCLLTPFAKICTYLNITDDLAAGNSLFKSEVLRAQLLVKTIQQLEPDQFGFTIMDEMFSGTSPKEGEAASYAVTKHIGAYPNSMCIIATHFPMLTTLEEDTYGVFANYKVMVNKNSDGSLNYPYKLEQGISDQHIAFDILVNEGVLDYSVLGMAQELLRQRRDKLYNYEF